MPSGLVSDFIVTHPGGGGEEFYSVQGAGCDQFMDNSWMGCHQGEVLSIINPMVSTVPRSTHLQSAFFIWTGVWGESASYKSNLGTYVGPVSISFRELEVW